MGGTATKPDLTLLYSQLGLRQDCSLAELQLAYRRRISELQPRQLHAHGGQAQTEESAVLLRTLVSLYTTATRFHRRYGRLPGAAPGVRNDRLANPVSPRPVPFGRPASVARSARSAQGLLGFSVLLMVVLFGLLTWWEWFAGR